MLMCVAGKDDSTIVFPDKREQLQHLFAANLPGLVHEDDCAARHGTPREKCTDSLRADETVAFQIGDLLALRCEDLDNMACLFERGLNFPQRETFARPCPAPE